MGFYDKKIKALYYSCPRLVILSVNSIFGKNYDENAKVTYLDKEQGENGKENDRFMDMLIEICGARFHFEFQLSEDNMAIRMYEYGVMETLKDIRQIQREKGSLEKYNLNVSIPQQAVIFLSGTHSVEEIVIQVDYPNGQKVTYQIPCVSASQTVDELIKRNLFILIPFQQVQLNSRMNQMKDRGNGAKRRIAREIYQYRMSAKEGLEKLQQDAILNKEEVAMMETTLADVEGYLVEKDEDVEMEVASMGDEDYIPWSERLMAQGEERKEKDIVIKLLEKGKSIEEIADLLDLKQSFVKQVSKELLATVE